MSLKAEAAIVLRGISGSWIQRTKRGTAPASTTAWESTAMENIKLIQSINFFKYIIKSSLDQNLNYQTVPITRLYQY